MSATQFVGIDVSKALLDVAVLPQSPPPAFAIPAARAPVVAYHKRTERTARPRIPMSRGRRSPIGSVCWLFLAVMTTTPGPGHAQADGDRIRVHLPSGERVTGEFLRYTDSSLVLADTILPRDSVIRVDIWHRDPVWVVPTMTAISLGAAAAVTDGGPTEAFLVGGAVGLSVGFILYLLKPGAWR
jgi:hypothetical protein